MYNHPGITQLEFTQWAFSYNSRLDFENLILLTILYLRLRFILGRLNTLTSTIICIHDSLTKREQIRSIYKLKYQSHKRRPKSFRFKQNVENKTIIVCWSDLKFQARVVGTWPTRRTRPTLHNKKTE